MKRVSVKPKTSDKFYIPAILQGMWVTLRHLLFHKSYTVQYPEERWQAYDGYRGAHRLNKSEKGHIKCVACEMCATACPSHCISIQGGPAPEEYGPDRERYPVKFEINMLRCIYCGFCEEACPKEAIELTKVYDFASYSREEMVWDREKLLEQFEKTKDEQPLKGRI